MAMKEEERITVRLSKEEGEQLRELAKESCRTRAGYLRHLFALYLREIKRDPAKKIP